MKNQLTKLIKEAVFFEEKNNVFWNLKTNWTTKLRPIPLEGNNKGRKNEQGRFKWKTAIIRANLQIRELLPKLLKIHNKKSYENLFLPHWHISINTWRQRKKKNS